jgi:hypothetical protein
MSVTKDEVQLSNTESHHNSPRTPEKWWKIHLFRGMMNDIRRRAPYYASDFTDAWDYRVLPSTSKNVLPVIIGADD